MPATSDKSRVAITDLRIEADRLTIAFDRPVGEAELVGTRARVIGTANTWGVEFPLLTSRWGMDGLALPSGDYRLVVERGEATSRIALHAAALPDVVHQGFLDLLAYRTIAGIGLGGEFGIGMALVAEVWPASKRARASSYVALGWQSGVLLAALLTPLLLRHIGWRGMFAVGVLPALIAWILRDNLHEPEVFVKSSKPARTTQRLRLLAADSRNSA